MNPIDILGSLLGGEKGGAGDILTEILGHNRPTPQRPQPAPQRPQQRQSPSSSSEVTASELEDMLGVGKSNPTSRPTASAQQNPPFGQPKTNTGNSRFNQPNATTGNSSGGGQYQGFPGDIFGQRPQASQVNVAIARPAELSPNDQAVLMIRAMINSAKIDGEINQDEQKFIVDRVGDTSQETIQFLRAEFARPLDVDEFSRSIPVGLEEKIYQLSVMAIKLDSTQEADYLRTLAKGLRISPDDVNRIHQQQNAPLLYR
jgi:uncharacterized membrane protein YebE (DUF533 family)